ncbi:MAG: demethoxyubiquinone hydroxylase family protein [Proteobacteria bacterium]|nr:demethoxyubiquinone hydroxylase family protein [Pseudomonadota bacterium]
MTSPLTPLIKSMIRVNQAGEYGAKRIYEGQLSLPLSSEDKSLIQEMLIEEENHLHLFNQLAEKYNIPPTALTPFWHIAGFGLGVASSLLGKKAMMACTVAVEEVIDEHYQHQLKTLRSIREDYEIELQTLIEKCHKDEIAHRDLGIEHQAEEMMAYPVFKSILKTGIKLAISLSKRF